MVMCRQITALYSGGKASTSAALEKMDAETLGDKQGEVKVKALLNALVDT